MKKIPSDGPTEIFARMATSAMTITLGDKCENHRGMQIIGTTAFSGMSCTYVRGIAESMRAKGYTCEICELNELTDDPEAVQACVLVVRGGLDKITGVVGFADKLQDEMNALKWDSKAKMYGRVVNKRARHNLCFADFTQDADFEVGKGTVVNFDSLPILSTFRQALPSLFGQMASNLLGEGNLYYDTAKCGIGYHGDAERKIVIGVRLGARIPLAYQWYKNSKPIGKRAVILPEHGDLYVMSEKAVGTDWKKKKVPTLRHSAGENYI